MSAFNAALVKAFEVTPSRETGLEIESFDSWSVAGSPPIICRPTFNSAPPPLLTGRPCVGTRAAACGTTRAADRPVR